MEIKDIIDEKVEKFRSDEKVAGILVSGERDAEECGVNFVVLGSFDSLTTETVDGTIIHTKFVTGQSAITELSHDSTETYRYINCRIIYDKFGQLTHIVSKAKKIYDEYITPNDIKQDLARSLTLLSSRLASALKSGDSFECHCLFSLSTYELIRAIWSVNNKPVPPMCSIRSMHSTLTNIPYDSWFEELFSDDFMLSLSVALTLIDWLLNELQ